MVQALAAFATARAFNALVSLASSVSIEGSAGVGLTGSFGIQPFQILDPVNDLVEQYSSAMKFSVASLVVQKILVEMASTWFFKLGVTALGFLFAGALYFKGGAYSFFFLRLLVLFVLVRFALVLVVLMNGIVDQAFVDKNISPKMQELSEVARQLESRDEEAGNGLSENERQGLTSMREELEAERNRLSTMLESAEEEISVAAAGLQDAREHLENMESDMGTIERLNVFSREEAHKEALEELDQKRFDLSRKQEEASVLEARIEETSNEIANVTALLEGRVVEEGWLTGVKRKLDGFADMARWERIKVEVESVIPEMLNLMAAFILKTLILPLVFLAILLKGFKYIWGVDPRRWAKGEFHKMKESA